MAVAGLRGTGDWEANERPKNFREMILWRDPNGQTPLTALMSKMRTESTDDAEFAWWEEELKPIRLNVTTTTVTATTVVVVGSGDATNLVAGDLLLVEATPVAQSTYQFEIVKVVSVASATQFTVGRGAAGTTADTMPALTNLLRIGSEFGEGEGSPTASTRNPTKFENYTQIFKTTYRITNTAKVTNLRTGDPIKNDKKRKMFDHSVGLEQAWLFGHKNEDTTGGSTNSKPLRSTGGLFQFLQEAYDATTAPTVKVWTTTAVDEDDILDEFHTVFNYNAAGAGNERLLLAGNGFLNYLNKIANSSASTRINFTGSINFFGMKLQRWELPQGTFLVKSHPLMNVNSLFTNGGFIINPAGVRYRPMTTRDTKFQDNIQANDADETKGQWLTEAGVEYNHLKTMKYVGIHV
jgi:hypothetical protein